MTYVVCLDVGEFDFIVLDFGTKVAAKQYKKRLKPYCKFKLKVKPMKKVREIEMEFVKDVICTSIKTDAIIGSKENDQT